MFSERQKRNASLGVLEKLRNKGMPARPEEDEMDSMFEVAVNDEEKEKEEDDTAVTPQPISASPENKKRIKKSQFSKA